MHVRTLGMAVLMLSAAWARSQQPDPLNIPVPAKVDDENHIATLHVYTNLMQVPVLILTSDHQRMKPVPEAKFRLSVDSGPRFKPTHVRREGDDPIELAILIDVTRPKNELLKAIDVSLGELARTALRPWDRVSIYAMDCNLTRTAYNIPADPAKVRNLVEAAMDASGDHSRKGKTSPCKQALPLWDSMASVATQLYALQGRRVLLVLTDGVDRGSSVHWSRLLQVLQVTSTATFGLMTEEEIASERGNAWDYRDHTMPAATEHGLAAHEIRFRPLCESSGGLELPASQRSLTKTLERFAEMLRERYIVEYPRRNDAQPGLHDLRISIGNDLAFVALAGITVPLADKKLLANPLTIPQSTDKGAAPPSD